MDSVVYIIDIVLHLNKYLAEFNSHYGTVTYALIFIIIFCETGLFFTPFLPGDSLLFVVGALCQSGGMNIWLSLLILISAGIIGDSSNYYIGKKLGPKVFRKENVRFLNRQYLDKAHAFYEKYGRSTVIVGRFFPVIRTFVPFVAGMGSMTYRKFLPSNVLGASLWVALFVSAGYFFGKIEFVEKNFSFVIIAIVLISSIPAIVGWFSSRKSKKDETVK